MTTATLADYVQERTFGDTGTWQEAIQQAGHLIRPDTNVWPGRPYGNTSGPYYDSELDTFTVIVYGLAHHLGQSPHTIGMPDIQRWLAGTLEPVRTATARPILAPLREPKSHLRPPWEPAVVHMSAQTHATAILIEEIAALLSAAGHEVPARPTYSWAAQAGPVTTMWQALLAYSPDEPLHEPGYGDPDPDPAVWTGILLMLRRAGFTAAGERVLG